ncbi:unnamed protein product [Urochloa decumbens]|uniref:C2 NT-type domain-containing protein n=1 Tax=Urochloa decumbens TaxID=240449 RepID=A0ABC9EU66_9POAL
MAEDPTLSELDALSHTMYQAHTKRRTASLVLLRSPGGDGNNAAAAAPAPAVAARPLSRRLSMSPFRSRPKQDKNLNDDDDHDDDDDSEALPSKSQSFAGVGSAAAPAPTAGGKKGIWGWKPIRALSHIGMHRVGCLFSVEVVAAQGLPPSMNGLRLAVSVRKKETRDGAVQTMPSRVVQGGADFEETLFLRCHLYCTGGGGGAGNNNKPVRFEPKPFIVSAVAVEAPELDLGRNAVDLSALVRESSEKSRHGERVRQWDMAFPLAGKAKGGELLVKIAFQVMDDGGVGLYSQPAVDGRTSTSSSSSSLFARKQSKSSFSIASPKLARPEPAITPSKPSPSPELLGIDDFKLDEPEPSPVVVEEEVKEEEPQEDPDDEFPEFDIVDKGVEGGQEEEKDDPPKEEAPQDKKEAEEEEEEDATAAADDGEEVVKEVVHDSARTWRLNELEAITNQIKALENMMHGHGDGPDPDAGTESPERNDAVVAALDADEEEVTREFLMLLEQGGDNEDGAAAKPTGPPRSPATSSLKSGKKPGADADATCYISDLGKVLGPVVQTRDGGYLAAMNPFDVPVLRKDLPKLAMQLSKPFLLLDQKLPGGGAEVFQRLCAGAGGSDALCARLAALAAMDDLVGKTAEQIAFEGMASAIITARGSKDGHLVATSTTAAQAVSVLRTMSAATSHGRQDRVATGIWNAHEAPVAVDEVLAFALQKIESMAVEALKVQADMTDDQAPFEVSPEKTAAAAAGGHVLDAAVPPEEWASACAGADAVSLLVVIQLRDPLRRYEAVGAPSVVVVQAARAAGVGDDEERRFKVANLHLGGLRLKSPDRRNMWDGEKQRLTAMHWLVAYGLGKVGRKRSTVAAGKAGNDVLWSMSSRVMADMWFKPLRNPDVKIPQK